MPGVLVGVVAIPLEGVQREVVARASGPCRSHEDRKAIMSADLRKWYS
jgi:hypothetical protein